MDSKQRLNNADETLSQHQETPTPCAKGCGFSGTPENRDFCSNCDAYYGKKEERVLKSIGELVESTGKSGDLAAIDSASSFGPSELSLCSEGSAKAVGNGGVVPAGESSVKKRRCDCCKKKVGLLGFVCRCGGLFCGVHRYAEEHGCSFDYKNAGRAALAKENPLCKGDKLQGRI